MDSVEKRALDAVAAAFAGLPLRTERRATPRGPVLLVHAPDARYALMPVWAGEGFPEDVRRALARARDLRPAPDEVAVVAARVMSPGGRAAAIDGGAGWADEAGNARIVAAPGLAIVREGQPRAEPRPPKRWSPSAGAVAECVLTRYVTDRDDRLPPVSKIAAWLDWSVGQVANVLAFFDAEGWTVKEGSQRGIGARRRIVDPGGLLGGWSAWHRDQPTDISAFGAHYRDPVAFANERVVPLLPPHHWCVTGWVALDLIAPFMTSVTSLDVYVDDDEYAAAVDAVSADGEFRRVESGARLRLLRAPRHVIPLADREPVLRVASPIRVYGDLLTMGARGSEAADHLREIRLGF